MINYFKNSCKNSLDCSLTEERRTYYLVSIFRTFLYVPRIVVLIVPVQLLYVLSAIESISICNIYATLTSLVKQK